MLRSKIMLLLLALAVVPAVAHAAKITKASATVTDGNIRAADVQTTTFHGGLLVTFLEVGVPANTPTTYLVTADCTATYGCINGGTNHPSAANKEGVGGPVSATAVISSDGNGKVSGAVGVPPIGPGAFGCPPGQFVGLIQVSYTNVVITDQTNGVSFSLPGTFSLVLVP